MSVKQSCMCSCNAHCQDICAVRSMATLYRRVLRDAVLSDNGGRKSSAVRYRCAGWDEQHDGEPGEAEGRRLSSCCRCQTTSECDVVNDASRLCCFSAAISADRHIRVIAISRSNGLKKCTASLGSIADLIKNLRLIFSTCHW